MSKSNKKKASTNSTENIVEVVVRSYEIKDAAIKDDFCHYSYEIIEGIGAGDTHTVKGSGIIEDDMRTSFSKLNVHLAVVDDVFKHKGIEIDDIDKYHNHEITQLYHVTGFKIKGSEENESIILIGNKYVSSGSRMELETPRIPMDSISSYKWYNELKAASDAARLEVALYKEGKYTPVKVEEPEPKLKQTKITFEKPAEDVADVPWEDDFQNAVV